MGLNALGLLKDRNFAVFMAAAALIMVPACFYWNYYNDFLVEIKMPFPQLVQSIAQASELIITMFLSFFLLRLRFKSMVLIGLAAWTGRYLLFACGVFPAYAWTNYIALALHGFAFAFIFAIGAMYVDKKAPKQLQASAQGLFALATYGLGSLAGTLAGGKMIDVCAIRDEAGKIIKDAAGAELHNWLPYWLWPALVSAVITALFFVALREKIDLRPESEG